MARGDQIYVMRPLINMEGAYEHHGIDCGDGTVIHYYKGGEIATIARTTMATFARGNPVYVKSYPVSYLPDVVVERAESRLGEQQYALLTNNCEHFATWCKVGKNESQQLNDYGVGLGTLNPFDSRQLVDVASDSGNPVEAMTLFTQAFDNAARVRGQLETQIKQAEAEIASWQRVAQEALKRNREDLARAALERKVQAKKQLAQVQGQLQQLDAMQETLAQNALKLQQRVALNIT
ncbi:MAG: lecithin retinol acyltransferase family protein [Elainella sp.]